MVNLTDVELDLDSNDLDDSNSENYINFNLTDIFICLNDSDDSNSK